MWIPSKIFCSPLNVKTCSCYIQSLEYAYLNSVGYDSFQIRKSKTSGKKEVMILPDIATCPQCLGEMTNPANRRFNYPFINCTLCGPRFSIIIRLPYDRLNTTMASFVLCHDCRKEYEDPLDRRFHAEPIACACCGPVLELWDSAGNVICKGHEALLACCNTIKEGKIAAVKGLGGFHLITDAANNNSVMMLRERKHREEKPFALLYPEPEPFLPFGEGELGIDRAAVFPEPLRDEVEFEMLWYIKIGM
jgi:hydrogenase maturation protein HypF